MSTLDRAVLAERAMAVNRHLSRRPATSACVAFQLGAPSSYADAFRRLEQADIIDSRLADQLVRAAGFRSVVAHAYDALDMRRVHAAAVNGPADLRAFLAVLRDARVP